MRKAGLRLERSEVFFGRLGAINISLPCDGLMAGAVSGVLLEALRQVIRVLWAPTKMEFSWGPLGQ